MASVDKSDDDGSAPADLSELLFLFTLFAVSAWVAAAFVFVL